MRRSCLVMVFIVGLLFNALFGIAAKRTLTARVWVFQGTLEEGQPRLVQARILPISSSPELAKLKALSEGSENEFKAVVIETLMDKENLVALDDLFLFKESQREDLPFLGRVILGRNLAYRVDLSHKVLSPTQLSLHLTLSKTKEGVIRQEKDDRSMLRNAYNATRDEEKMELVADQQLTLGFDDPVIIGTPYEDRPYFMVIKVTFGEPEPKRKSSPKLKAPPIPNIVPAPPAIEKTLPSYPAELRRRHIRGEVGLRVAIDEKGIVRFVQVLTPLHPYLDYTASQALWEWRFEPVLYRGKPVPAAFDYSFDFDPRVYAEEMISIEEGHGAVDVAAREEEARVLDGCAEYCRKLRDAALFYICEETIKETTHALGSPDRLSELSLRGRDYSIPVTENAAGEVTGVVVDRPQIMSIRNVERVSYSCDYQMIRRFGEVEERRIVLKENGHRIADRVELLEESRYSALAPIASVLGILDEDHQSLFNYRILKEDKVFGKAAYVIEAMPKLGDADGVRSAKAWVEKGSYRILRCEVEGVPLDGYDDVLSESVLLNIRPYFLRKYEYRTENGGVLLPDRTTVRIEYPSLIASRRETKSKIDLSYENFKFFTVETGHEIKK